MGGRRSFLKIVLNTLALVLGFFVFNSSSLAANSDRLILVSGATGTQGGATVRALLEKGFAVRAMTRNPGSERAMALAELGTEVVQGDFDDAESLDRALSGVYGAFSVQQWRNIGTDAEIRQGSDFADAAKRAGISHFIYTSNGAAAEKTGIPHFDSKYAIEEHIRSIDIPYTIIGPRGFMSDIQGDFAEGLQSGVMEGALDPDRLIQYIAPRDIGRFAALAFEDPENWIGKQIGIAGDEISSVELAKLLSEISGKKIAYKQTPWEEVVENTSPEFLKVLDWSGTTNFSVDVEGLRTQYPWMTTLQEYLAEQEWLSP
jgi:uncharacterized protein YbjT (DUF2867 family)